MYDTGVDTLRICPMGPKQRKHIALSLLILVAYSQVMATRGSMYFPCAAYELVQL